MVDVQTISVVIAAASVVIGVINSIYSSRIQERQRQTEIETRRRQFFMQFVYRVIEKDYWERFNEAMYHQELTNPEDFWRDYGPDNPKGYAARASLMAFYNFLGNIIEMESLDTSILYYFMPHTLRLWKKFEPWVEYQRESTNDPSLYKGWELLCN